MIKKILAITFILVMLCSTPAMAMPAAYGSLYHAQLGEGGALAVAQGTPKAGEFVGFACNFLVKDFKGFLRIEFSGESLRFHQTNPVFVYSVDGEVRIEDVPAKNIFRKLNSITLSVAPELFPKGYTGIINVYFEAENQAKKGPAVAVARFSDGKLDEFRPGASALVRIDERVYSIAKQGEGADQLENINDLRTFNKNCNVYIIGSYYGDEIFRLVTTKGGELVGLAKKDESGAVQGLFYNFRAKAFRTKSGALVERAQIDSVLKGLGISFLKPVKESLFLDNSGHETTLELTYIK